MALFQAPQLRFQSSFTLPRRKYSDKGKCSFRCSSQEIPFNYDDITRNVLSGFAASIMLLSLPNQVAALELPGKPICLLANALDGIAPFKDNETQEQGTQMMMMKGMTAKNFDPVRYSGRWFEVASLKRGFAGQGQEDCHCTQGIYTFDAETSSIEVDTICVHGGPTGYITGIRGRVQCFSEVDKEKTETDLERQEMVKEKCFLRFPTLPFIPKEPYDVIATDYDNFALVSGAKDKSFVQENLIIEILKRAGMSECNPTLTPITPETKLHKRMEDEEKEDIEMYRTLVGALLYVTHTRPDIQYAVNLVSRFVADPSKQHGAAIKQILRYLKGTKEFGLYYEKQSREKEIRGSSDSDWAGDSEDRRSTSGYIFYFGKNPISWNVQKQATVALSSAEAEYVAMASAACEALWLQQLLQWVEDEDTKLKIQIEIKSDSVSAIALARNPVLHKRSKHIDMRHHFLREKLEEGSIELSYCSSENQVADILTKPLPRQRFAKLRDELKVRLLQLKGGMLAEGNM